MSAVTRTFFASTEKENICIIGNSGVQINVQEFATNEKYNINVNILILNNHGHGIIQGTQDNWLHSRHHALKATEGGLPDLIFKKKSEAYGIPKLEIREQ